MPAHRNKTYKKRKTLRRKTRNRKYRKNYKRGGVNNNNKFNQNQEDMAERRENFRNNVENLVNTIELAVENHTPINNANLLQELQELQAEATELDNFFGGNQLMNELVQASATITQLLANHEVVEQVQQNNGNNNMTVKLGSVRNNNNNNNNNNNRNNLSVYYNLQNGGLVEPCSDYKVEFKRLKERLNSLSVHNQNGYDNIGKELTNLEIRTKNGGCKKLAEKIEKYIINEYYDKSEELGVNMNYS